MVIPILGWLCNALETVDTETFKMAAISLIVAGLLLIKTNKLFDEAGNPAIKILKPGNAVATSEHDVDGLSGATLTSNGVQYTFEFWTGAKGFAPFLTKVRDGALNNG